MKRYLTPILLFLAYVVLFFARLNIHNETLWRMTDVIAYCFFPASILILFFQLPQTKKNYFIIVTFLFFIWVLMLGIHWEFINGFASEIFLNKKTLPSKASAIQGMFYYLWSFTFILSFISIFKLFLKHKKIDPDNYLKNRLFYLTLVWFLVLYILDYGYFNAHPGWSGWHGHSFWENPMHLH